MLPKLPRLRAKRHADGSLGYWFDHGGKPRRWEPLGRDETLARRRYDDLIARTRIPVGTIDRMLADCLDAIRGKVAVGTLANYKGYRKHLAAVFDPDPRQITQADVLRYLKLCPRKTFRNEIGFLSLAFVNWMDQGRLDFNPVFGVRCKRPPARRDRLLLDAEIDRIVAAADERLAVAIELAYAMGLRIGDLCALRWADVAGIVETQKTGQRQAFERPDWFGALLARAKALQDRVASLCVLCDRRGHPWKPNTLRDHWNDACARAGVQNAHFHDLRAAGGTEVDRRGGDAQAFLGHADAKTTKLYLRGKRVNVVAPLKRKA